MGMKDTRESAPLSAQWEGNDQKPTGGQNLKLPRNAFEFKMVLTITSFRNLGKMQVR